MLTGRMMDFPLTLTHFLERARTYFGRSEIVSRQPDKSLHRYTYADFYRRTCKLANALTRLGVKPGDRVASLCWNHHRHLELYFGVPAMGAVLHTLNLRLHPNDLGYIARHAEDRIIVVDRSLLPAPREVHRRRPLRRARHRHPRRRPRSRGSPRLREAARSPRRTPSPSPSSTERPPRCSATRPAPPATPRASSTAIAPACCTRSSSA